VFRNSGFYFILLLFVALIGFWPSYFSRWLPDIDAYTHFHAVSMLLWLCLLIAQAFLIRYKQYRLHRMVGKFSYLLVPVLIVSLVLLAHYQIVIEDGAVPPFRRYILFLQLSLLCLFIIAYGLAILYRHQPARHARYMITTAFTLIDPAVARIPLGIPDLPFSYQVLTFALTDLLIILMIILERKQTKGREVFPLMLIIFVFFQWLNLNWTHSHQWTDFANWFAGLPLT